MGILIGFDDSSFGLDALVLGLKLAAGRNETVTVVTAYPDAERGLAVSESPWLREAKKVAEKKLDAAREMVANRDDVAFHVIGPASASRALHEYAQQTDPSIVVVGSSERAPVGRLSLGSNVERLLAGAPCPVAVAPRGYRNNSEEKFRFLSVAYDESPEAKDALDIGHAIAQRDGLSLRLVAVSASPDEDRQRRMDDIVNGFGAVFMASAEVIVDSDVAHTLTDLPGQPTDLLLCGSRGYGPVRQVLLGSVSARVIRDAAYPVIVVPRGA